MRQSVSSDLPLTCTKLIAVRVRNMGYVVGSVMVGSRFIGRLWLWLGSGPHVVGRLGAGMRVIASFKIISRPVSRLGLTLGPHVVGRLGSGIWLSASFQLRWIALYRLAHGDGGRGKCPTPCKRGRGNCPGGGMSGGIC